MFLLFWDGPTGCAAVKISFSLAHELDNLSEAVLALLTVRIFIPWGFSFVFLVLYV